MANPSSKTEAHGAGAHGHPTLGLYVIVYASLLGLTSLTFAVSQFAPKTMHMPAALLIATGKATLVALIFMHLKYMGGAPRLTFLVAVGFVVLLIAGILADVFTRFPLTNSHDSELSGMAEKSLEARHAYGPEAPDFAAHGGGAKH